jgi:hypothetical protein
MAGPGRPIGSKNNPVQSAKHPSMGMTWKRAIKLEKIARLSIDPVGYSNEQIANFVGCDKQTVVLIRQTPAYHAKMLEIATGITSTWDADLRTDTENMRAEMKSMVPSAMMVIRNALTSKNESLRFKAAAEVMDREGTLAKVSKSSVAVVVAPNLEIDASVAQNIMTLMAGAPKSSDAQIVASDGFTVSADAAGVQQKGMSDDNNTNLLDTLDILVKDQKPN